MLMRASPARVVRPAPPRGIALRRPVHPGRFLDRQVLQPLAISQSAAARLLGMSRRRVHELVQGQRAMSPDTAIRCALAFGLDVGWWLGLQARWDSWQQWQAICRAAADPAGAAAPCAASVASSAPAVPSAPPAFPAPARTPRA